MKHTQNILQFLNEKFKLKKFLVLNGCHVDKVISITENFETTKHSGTCNTIIKTGHVTYIIEGEGFNMVVTTDKNYSNFYLNKLDLPEF